MFDYDDIDEDYHSDNRCDVCGDDNAKWNAKLCMWLCKTCSGSDDNSLTERDVFDILSGK